MSTAAADLPYIHLQCDPQLRMALDAYIADFNKNGESRATIRTTTEAALKKHLADKGFWPFTPPKKARA